MLNHNHGPLKPFGFLLGVEIEEGVATPEQVLNKMLDAVSFMEGVQVFDAECLGEVEEFDALASTVPPDPNLPLNGEDHLD